MIPTSLRKVLVSISVASALLSASVLHAETAPDTAPIIAPKSVKSAAGVGAARFDWLAKSATSEAAPVRVARTQLLGRGTWVCSPAGFNRKSRCVSR
ncbi:hypothetical protein [Celeribacter sp. PS-C1]|uniref:hypothetical protein n=1 Tax=Celeribacter sp. PS-C1 TaxID=2820813 RepID=UPI001CA5E2F5|nr:hypothetical protein [Celeribacter sp. PS-C1]MBW6418511.1 hypothetical protein [Celeribacter sp. PS-C1]